MEKDNPHAHYFPDLNVCFEILFYFKNFIEGIFREKSDLY